MYVFQMAHLKVALDFQLGISGPDSFDSYFSWRDFHVGGIFSIFFSLPIDGHVVFFFQVPEIHIIYTSIFQRVAKKHPLQENS